MGWIGEWRVFLARPGHMRWKGFGLMRGRDEERARPVLGKDPKRKRARGKWWERVGCSEAEWPKLLERLAGWKKWWLGKTIRFRLWPQPCGPVSWTCMTEDTEFSA
jgi:hypothetical protein